MICGNARYNSGRVGAKRDRFLQPEGRQIHDREIILAGGRNEKVTRKSGPLFAPTSAGQNQAGEGKPFAPGRSLLERHHLRDLVTSYCQ